MNTNQVHTIPLLKFEKPTPTQDSVTVCLGMESSCLSSLQSTLKVSWKKSRRWRRNCILEERAILVYDSMACINSKHIYLHDSPILLRATVNTILASYGLCCATYVYGVSSPSWSLETSFSARAMKRRGKTCDPESAYPPWRKIHTHKGGERET